MQTSAGILLYRFNAEDELEVFLVHPGGPYFSKKDKGWWGIPKGLQHENEDLLITAKREFEEEIGFLPEGDFIELGSVKLKSGKTVYAWAVESNLPENWLLTCNTFTIEWPPKSGKYKEFDEVDKAQFFTLNQAEEYISAAQSTFLEKLHEALKQKIKK